MSFHICGGSNHMKGKSRGFIPQGIRNQIQAWIPGVQPEIVQYTDPTTGEKITKLDDHGEAWDPAIIAAAEAAYPGLLVG